MLQVRWDNFRLAIFRNTGVKVCEIITYERLVKINIYLYEVPMTENTIHTFRHLTHLASCECI